MAQEQECPISATPVAFSERYPRYVCESCFAKAADEDGRSLTFTNVALSGGFAALYRDTHEERQSHVCYIDNIKCWADEARFGGIVIQPDGEEDR